jgi:hypothetical protein
MVKVKANGRILDSSGKPVIGRVYFYLKTGTHLMSVMHEDTKVIVGPGTPTYTWTGFECDAIPGANPGWFDYPGGLEPGEYVLHIHYGGKKEWAWPFNLTDGLKPQDVYIGGKQAPVPGPEPIPGNYPPITPLDKQFTKGTFTAAISYYGMFGAPLDRIKRDLDKARRAGFGNARVWVDWFHPKQNPVPNARLTNPDGSLIEAKAKLLDDVLAFCLQIGMSLDLTMETAHYDFVKISGEGYKIEAHKKALRNILTRWGKHPCVKIVDVDNEAETRGPSPGSGSPGGGHTSPGRFAELMAVAKSVPHTCLVSLSASGDGAAYKSDYDDGYLFRDAKGDILLPHMLRKSGWGADEGPKGKALSQACGGMLVYHQEPARNNYNGQNWPLSEFEQSFKTTKAAGAVGCCFHTGAGFRLEQKDMFEQFDNTEKQVITNVYNWIK